MLGVALAASLFLLLGAGSSSGTLGAEPANAATAGTPASSVPALGRNWFALGANVPQAVRDAVTALVFPGAERWINEWHPRRYTLSARLWKRRRDELERMIYGTA